MKKKKFIVSYKILFAKLYPETHPEALSESETWLTPAAFLYMQEGSGMYV